MNPSLSVLWAKTAVFGDFFLFSETDCPWRGESSGSLSGFSHKSKKGSTERSGRLVGSIWFDLVGKKKVQPAGVAAGRWQEFSSVPQSRPGLRPILHPSPYDQPYHAMLAIPTWPYHAMPYNALPCHPYLGPCSGLRAILHPSPGRPYAYRGLPDVTTSGNSQQKFRRQMYSHIKG